MSHGFESWTLNAKSCDVIAIKPSRSGSKKDFTLTNWHPKEIYKTNSRKSIVNGKEVCYLTDHKKQLPAGEVLFLQNLPQRTVFQAPL